MTSVPLVTRSYTDLLALQPGVSPTSSGLAGGQGGQFSATGFTFTNISGDLNAGNLSVNGQRESSNRFPAQRNHGAGICLLRCGDHPEP